MRTQSSLKLACLLGVSLLGVASAAQARQAAEPNTALEEVVVTAERRSENLQSPTAHREAETAKAHRG